MSDINAGDTQHETVCNVLTGAEAQLVKRYLRTYLNISRKAHCKALAGWLLMIIALTFTVMAGFSYFTIPHDKVEDLPYAPYVPAIIAVTLGAIAAVFCITQFVSAHNLYSQARSTKAKLPLCDGFFIGKLHPTIGHSLILVNRDQSGTVLTMITNFLVRQWQMKYLLGLGEQVELELPADAYTGAQPEQTESQPTELSLNSPSTTGEPA